MVTLLSSHGAVWKFYKAWSSLFLGRATWINYNRPHKGRGTWILLFGDPCAEAGWNGFCIMKYGSLQLVTTFIFVPLPALNILHIYTFCHLIALFSISCRSYLVKLILPTRLCNLVYLVPRIAYFPEMRNLFWAVQDTLLFSPWRNQSNGQPRAPNLWCAMVVSEIYLLAIWIFEHRQQSRKW